MLKIIAWIAGIFGILLLFLLLLFLLALLLRVRVEADKRADGPLRLAICYGPLQIPLLPRPKRTKKPAKPPAPPKETAPKQEKRSHISFENVDLLEVLFLALDLLVELRNRLRLPRLRVNVVFSAGDAAKTGVLLGQAAAISGMILPFLEQNFIINDFCIDVDGDFQAETAFIRTALGITASLRPIHLPLMAWKYRRQILPLVRALFSGGEGAEIPDQTVRTRIKRRIRHERTSHSKADDRNHGKDQERGRR